jgi:predicted HNH restriction endonuclease
VGCGFNFEEKYGSRGAGFIHVHHLNPIADAGGAYKIDPVADLRPVCANCHAMIHYKEPMLTIDELQRLVK